MNPVSETSSRPLAYVERISNLSPIPSADVIETATIRGWNVVVKKSKYQVGETVIYAEIDSILPPWKTFIEDRLDKVNFRIKTIKLRGQISQGYCIPLSALEDHPERKLKLVHEATQGSGEKLPVILDKEGNERIEMKVGTDMTELIGVKKYEVFDNLTLMKSMYGVFPAFLRKTDQTRVQNRIDELKLWKGMKWELTEKLDGTSITVYFNNSKYGVCSRNLELKLDEMGEVIEEAKGIDMAEEIKKKEETGEPQTEQSNKKSVESLPRFLDMTYGLKERLTKYGKNIALQGELIGPKIQGNCYQIKSLCWMIFDVFFIDQRRYALRDERVQIINELGLKPEEMLVPFLGVYETEGTDDELSKILKMAEGSSKINKSAMREGVVFKSLSILKSEGDVVSFKAISNAWLLKHDK